MPLNEDFLYQALDELRAVSSSGLYYAGSEYDKERYERVLSIALRLLSSLEERPYDDIVREFREDNWLHISPAVGAEAVVVQDDKILLIKLSDNSLWAVPGGLVEVGETLAQAAQRELLEETGIHCRIRKLLGIFDSRLWRSKTKAHLYHTVFLAEADSLVPTLTSEALDAAFFNEANLPELSPGHHLRVPVIFKLLSGEIPAPYFDPLSEV